MTNIIFSYDSLLPKFFGTKISCIHNFSDFYVVAQKVNEVESQILGMFSQYGNCMLNKYSKPFDVTIYAYDPLNDISYEAKVGGITITKIQKQHKNQKCYFVAQTIMNWHPINKKEKE